jgi:hypothetical protein
MKVGRSCALGTAPTPRLGTAAHDQSLPASRSALLPTKRVSFGAAPCTQMKIQFRRTPNYCNLLPDRYTADCPFHEQMPTFVKPERA